MEEMVLDLTYYPHAAVSCTLFLLLYRYLSPTVSAHYFSKYSQLPWAKKCEWNTRVNSSVHAIFVSVTCLYVMLYEDEVNNDPVWGESAVMRAVSAIVVGYMFSDSIIMLLNYKDVGEVFYIFHHSAVIYAYYFVMTYGILQWFANLRLVAEFSTPFVNKRWYLDVLGYPKSSPIFLFNGAAMTFMFFVVRVLSIPVYWYRVYSISGSPDCDKLGYMWLVHIGSCIILDAINMYWFLKIFQGARKIIGGAIMNKIANGNAKAA